MTKWYQRLASIALLSAMPLIASGQSTSGSKQPAAISDDGGSEQQLPGTAPAEQSDPAMPAFTMPPCDPQGTIQDCEDRFNTFLSELAVKVRDAHNAAVDAAVTASAAAVIRPYQAQIVELRAELSTLQGLANKRGWDIGIPTVVGAFLGFAIGSGVGQ